MKKLIIVPLLMGFLAFGMVTPSHAGGIAITATGVRAVSLGGAYRALSGDWSGGYWNPAGLTQVKNWNFGASVSFITPLAKITLAPYQGHRLYGFAYREAVAKPQTFIIPNLGLVKTLDNGLSVGLGLFIPFGLGATWDLYNPVPGFGNTANFPKDDNVGNVQVMDFHLSLAYPVTEQLSLGVGAGLVYSTLSMEQTTVTKIAALNPQLAPIAIAPHDHFPVDQTLKGTGVSASASVGLQLKATDQLTLGLAARFYQNVPLKGSVVGDAYFPYSANALGTLKALHDAKQLSDAEYQQAAALFSGTKQQMIDDNEVKASMPLPMNIGAGVAFRPMENLLLSFDVSFTQWSVWNVIKIENLTMKDGTPVEASLTEDWTDGIRYSLGTEYTLMKTGGKDLVLRLGYYYDPSPIPDETLNPGIPDISPKNSITAGFGFTQGKYTINAVYSHLFIKNRDVKKWVLEPSGANENYAGLYKVTDNEFHIGFGYSF